MGLEVIVTLSETAPAMVRKNAKFMPLLGKYSVLFKNWNLSKIVINFDH